MSSRLSQMPVHCEVVEIRNSADEIGFPCSRTASTQCSDCGSELCESHAETCGGCLSVFCPSCLSFHSAQHSKPAHGERQSEKGLKTGTVVTLSCAQESSPVSSPPLSTSIGSVISSNRSFANDCRRTA